MDIGAVSSFPATRPTAPRTAPSAPSGRPADAVSSGDDGIVYVSPAIKYDQTARMAVLLFRDADTGETKDQIPSEHVVEAYRRTASRAPDGASGAGAPTTPTTLQGASADRAPASRSGGGAPPGGSSMPAAGSMPAAAMAGGSGGGASVSVTV